MIVKQITKGMRAVRLGVVLGGAVAACVSSVGVAHAQCHPANSEDISGRGDIVNLPADLKSRVIELAQRPHTYAPMQAFAEADGASQLFQYYLLDTTGFEQNVFTARIPGVNDHAQATAANQADCGLATIGAVRVALEPKPGLPTDPNDPRAFIDVWTDISGLFVINNESGWYEGWMIHDMIVPAIAAPRRDGSAQFGTITQQDANMLLQMGAGNNAPGHVFTMDGMAPHLPSPGDRFPNRQTNVVSLYESMGAYNAMQQSDVHSYWEFNYEGTNWIHPLYELPFTGGFPDKIGQPPDAFQDGEIGALQSIVPGPAPGGHPNKPQDVGDDPNLPRDPDKFEADDGFDNQREFRQRGIPSGLAHEIFLDVFMRQASFQPATKKLDQRLNQAYNAEVQRVSGDKNGIITAAQGDIDTSTDGFSDNSRLYLPATAFNRFAVTREINDGLLAPRFAPSQRAWVLSGVRVPVDPPVPASAGRDSDDR
jgi:hypothetical protein